MRFPQNHEGDSSPVLPIQGSFYHSLSYIDRLQLKCLLIVMLPADPQWSWRVYSHWPRWWQREALTLSTEKPFPHHPQYQIGGEIRGRQVHASSKSEWCGGGAGPKRSVRLACRKKEVVEMWTHSNHIKVWEVDWSFWKSTGPFHTKN